MPTLASTQTFTNGNVLSATALTNHVVDATPLATFISGQTAVAAPIPADEFLIATAGSASAKKVSLSTLAANLPTGTTAVDLAVTGAATITGNLTANGNSVIGNAATDTLTVNAASSFGGDTTLGGAAVTSATWSRTTTTLTVTKTAHGLTSGNTRYFVFTGTNVTSSVLNGIYTVTVTSVDAFTVTVANAGDTVGSVTWYERSLTINSTLAGSLQGNISVNVTSTEVGTGDEFLFKDSSDSNRLKTTAGGIIKAWANISANPVTIPGTYDRSGSGTMTVTRAAHGFRVNDVAWFAGTAFTAGWYSIVTVTNSSTFTISTGTTSSQTNAPINWYQHSLLASNNIYSAYGKPTERVIHVNFTNKPPSVDSYIVNLATAKFTADNNLLPPQANNILSKLSDSLVKTVNGFGFVSYLTTGPNTETAGEFHIQSTW
jgi:hypothetical protein